MADNAAIEDDGVDWETDFIGGVAAAVNVEVNVRGAWNAETAVIAGCKRRGSGIAVDGDWEVIAGGRGGAAANSCRDRSVKL